MKTNRCSLQDKEQAKKFQNFSNKNYEANPQGIKKEKILPFCQFFQAGNFPKKSRSKAIFYRFGVFLFV